MRTITKSLIINKLNTSKLVLGFVGIAATTIIGTAGIAAAQTKEPNMPNPLSKAACVDFAHLGFKNRGQCVSWWEHHHNPGRDHDGDHGHGYGGNNNVSTSVNLDVNGNNNVISIVINYFFGH